MHVLSNCRVLSLCFYNLLSTLQGWSGSLCRQGQACAKGTCRLHFDKRSWQTEGAAARRGRIPPEDALCCHSGTMAWPFTYGISTKSIRSCRVCIATCIAYQCNRDHEMKLKRMQAVCIALLQITPVVKQTKSSFIQRNSVCKCFPFVPLSCTPSYV